MLLLVYKYYTSSEVNYFSALILDNTVHCETVKYPASVAYVSLSQVVDIQMYWIMAKKKKTSIYGYQPTCQYRNS